MESQKEQTLCGWCGKALKERRILYHGEWICYSCKHGQVSDRYKVSKMLKGVVHDG